MYISCKKFFNLYRIIFELLKISFYLNVLLINFKTMKKTLKSLFAFGILLLITVPVLVTTNSCDKETLKKLDDFLSSDEIKWLASYLVDKEKLDSIPQDLDINDNKDITVKKVDLTSKFPPIGNQGQYGTCVAWAAGYNLKTALNGIEKGYSAADLANPANQTSPIDLFWSIPSSDKGADCNGTYFEAALDRMIARGAATLDVAPYVGLGNCTSSPSSSWDSKAAGNKLENYRKIADSSDPNSMTVENFKAYLSQGRPIVFGAKLGDKFMQWNSSEVIKSETYNNPGMQHAYHALILAGFDDDKNAFRVINSWGASWGDNGMIWVDYTFFLKSFCYAAFVAQNKSNTSITNNTVGSGDIADGDDLLAYNLEEGSDSTDNVRDRRIYYDVYNSGKTTIESSKRWSILYLYYNAFDANDYGILIHDYYTDEFTGALDGPLTKEMGGLGLSESYWNNYNVKSGQSVASAVYSELDVQFQFKYTMPDKLNGKYYLVLYADGLEKIKEVNEDNNFFFISRKDGKPFEYKNGVLMNPEAKRLHTKMKKQPVPFANTEYQTLVKQNNLNTYSPLEIYKKLKAERVSGRLAQKVKAFDQLKSLNKAKNFKNAKKKSVVHF